MLQLIVREQIHASWNERVLQSGAIGSGGAANTIGLAPEGSGRVFLAVLDAHISQLRVFFAVRFARHGRIVAESEAPGPWLANRPAARGGAAAHGNRLDGLDGAKDGLRLCHRARRWGGVCLRLATQRLDVAGGKRGGSCRTGERRQGRRAQARGGGWPVARVAADGRWPRIKLQPMRLSDNGVLGNSQAAADFGGGMTLCPQVFQLTNRVISPYHMQVPRADYLLDTVWEACARCNARQALPPQISVDNRVCGSNATRCDAFAAGASERLVAWSVRDRILYVEKFSGRLEAVISPSVLPAFIPTKRARHSFLAGFPWIAGAVGR